MFLAGEGHVLDGELEHVGLEGRYDGRVDVLGEVFEDAGELWMGAE